jgi:magnesium-transporting ATPase (P-type)
MKKLIAVIGLMGILLTSGGMLLQPTTAFAEAANVGDPVTPPTDSTNSPVKTFDNVMTFIRNVLKYIAIFFWIAAVLYIFLAAFTYLQGGKDPKKIEEANKRLLTAAIAMAVGILAYGMPALVESILKQGVQ